MVSSLHQRAPVENRLLAKLPPEERAGLLSRMEQVYLPLGTVIIEPEEPIRELYFPTGALISLVSLTEEGKSVEAGVVGCEGMAGIPSLLGDGTTPMRSVVQIEGAAIKARAEVVQAEFAKAGALQKAIYGYLHALMVAFSQSAACNRLHPIEGRLARWLLIASDAIQSETLHLTHEYLSTMLGIRRAGVTQAAVYLRSLRVIDYHRGEIHITDRKGLEDASCECYEVVKDEFNRMLK
jgi:CRP-like cAMP-binding protein